MANTTIVPIINTVINSSNSSSAHAQEQCALVVQPETISSTGEKTEADCLSLIRQSLVSKGISSQPQGTILNSWRSGTKKQYKVYLDKWQLYAIQWDVDPLHPTLNHALNFLQELYEKGLGYGCINTARSALSSLIILDGSMTVGMHPLVQRFVKGVSSLDRHYPDTHQPGILQ